MLPSPLDTAAYGLVEALAMAPDDAIASRATTAVVAVGGTSLGTLELLRDRDWFAVDLVAGHRYSFAQNGIGLLDPLLRLRGGNGGLLASNDDAGPSSRDALIQYTATSTGRHFLDAGAWNDSLTGTYNVAVTDITPSLPRDDFVASTATREVVAPGAGRTGVLGQNGDHDWFRVDVLASHSYVFRVDGVTLADPTLSLRDGIGLQLAFNDDGSASSRNALIRYTAPASGSLFLDVGAFANGGVGTYTLSVTDLTPQAPAAVPVGFSPLDGFGEVNVARALERLLGRAIARQPALGGDAWNLDRLGATSAWAAGATGAGITVAVIDSGLDLTHPDLDGAIWTHPGELAGNGLDDDGNGHVDDVHGWDFVDGDADPTDLNGHGTFVAGTIAAEDNGSGTTGVAPGVRILPVRVLDASGSGSYATMVNGIRYATAQGARVINLSLGGTLPSPALQAAIAAAEAAGVVVVMAAGNSGGPVPAYPAAYAGQWGLAVGAVDAGGSLTGFSNRAGSAAIDYLTAPGVDVTSTLPGDRTSSWRGTSMATAHVAGAAALLLSARPSLAPREVKALLLATAGHGPETAVAAPSSAGLDALRALQRGLSGRWVAVAARWVSRPSGVG